MYWRTSGSILTCGSLREATCSKSVLANCYFMCGIVVSIDVNRIKLRKTLLNASARYCWSARSRICQYCQKTLLKIFSAIFLSCKLCSGFILMISVKGCIKCFREDCLLTYFVYFWWNGVRADKTLIPSYDYLSTSVPSNLTWLFESGQRLVEFLIFWRLISSLKL